MEPKIILSIPSYNRPLGHTLKALELNPSLSSKLDIIIYVYQFDEHLNEYLELYGNKIHIISEKSISSPNLSKKRQYILDKAIENGYDYMICIDDDDAIFLENGEETSLTNAIEIWFEDFMEVKKVHPNIIMGEASFRNEPDKSILYDNIAGSHSIFDLSLCKKLNYTYAIDSKCEDAEFSIDTIIQGFDTCRIRKIALVNDLFGVRGSDQGGLSYRFKDSTDRLATEANYIYDLYKEKYPLAFEIKNDRPKFRPSLFKQNYR